MVMACKYVDDIVIEAPYVITEDLIKSLNINKVVNVSSEDDSVLLEHAKVDQFEVPKRLGIYEELNQNPDELTVSKIAHRVAKNKEALELKFQKKSKSESAYYQQKQSGIIEK
jgi:ethanolamine-phosphate cytidylyltransferase